MVKTVRNLSALVFVLSYLAFSGAQPALLGQELCAPAPQPRCANYTGLECDEWPQGGCYLLGQQGQMDEQAAQAVCDAFLSTAPEECSWDVQASRDGECYWFCQFEMPNHQQK